VTCLYGGSRPSGIGVLIGPDGATKDRLQAETGTRIAVDPPPARSPSDEVEPRWTVLALKAA